MKKRCLPVFVIACLLWGSFASITFAYTGNVVSITDGDTISVFHDGKAEKIRLTGIDCPELHQAFGRVAKRFVADEAFGQIVRVEVAGTDRYGRTLAEVFLSNGVSLNRALVEAGLAWWFFKYSDDVTLGHLEVAAKAAKRGLWKEGQALPPWVFRKLGREPRRKSEAAGATGPDGILATPDARLPIFGNRRSHKYHRPDCRNYDDIAEKNRVPFSTVQEAEAAGYVMAGNCPQ